MKFRTHFLLSAVVMTGLVGCSAETKEKAKDAAEKTGEAAVSAGEAAVSAGKDTAENIGKAAEKAKDALDGSGSK